MKRSGIEAVYPSLLDRAIVSANCQRFPFGMISPVRSFLPGVQSGASFIVVGVFESLLVDFARIPCCSKSWNALLSVSLFTASKYERSP